MGSIRSRPETGALFMDFKFLGQRLREQTTLADNPANRKRLQKALDKIETDIALGTFDYEKTFGKSLPERNAKDVPVNAELNPTAMAAQAAVAQTPNFREFANQWFGESEVTWRRSYKITQRGALDKYILPNFGDKQLGMVTKADVLAFRATLSKLKGRGKNVTMTARRINAIMKPPVVVNQVVAFLLASQAALRSVVESLFLGVLGLRCTSPTGHQLRLAPVHRRGFFSRAAA